MRKIHLKSSTDVRNFLSLLDLPGIHQDLGKLVDDLIAVENEKQLYLEKDNYEKAAESRQKELQVVGKIIESLNQKDILHDGVLEVDVSVYKSI